MRTTQRRSGADLAYAVAFVTLVASVIVLGVAGASLFRSGSELSTSTSLFWVSIVLSIAAVVAAIVAVDRSRAKR